MVAVNEFGIDSATATAIVENSRIGAIADGEDWSEGVVADLMPTERVERADRIGRHLAHQIFKSLNNQP